MSFPTAHVFVPKLALSAAILAAAIALPGCSATVHLGPISTISATPVAASPMSATPSASPAAGTSASASYRYEDARAGYGVSFPGEPTSQPLKIAGNSFTARIVGYGDPSGLAYIAHGEILDSDVNLRGSLFGYLNGYATGQIDVSSDELDGLSAVRGDFTSPDGLQATTVVAGEGKHRYQLVVVGGTPADRQEFFDSFEFLG